MQTNGNPVFGFNLLSKKRNKANIAEIIIYLPLPHILGGCFEANISYLRRCEGD